MLPHLPPFTQALTTAQVADGVHALQHKRSAHARCKRRLPANSECTCTIEALSYYTAPPTRPQAPPAKTNVLKRFEISKNEIQHFVIRPGPKFNTQGRNSTRNSTTCFVKNACFKAFWKFNTQNSTRNSTHQPKIQHTGAKFNTKFNNLFCQKRLF